MATEFYCIAPPIGPWDEKRRAEIELDLARRTIGETAAESWRILARAGIDGIDHMEFSRRVQHWHDFGYRVRRIALELLPAGDA